MNIKRLLKASENIDKVNVLKPNNAIILNIHGNIKGMGE